MTGFTVDRALVENAFKKLNYVFLISRIWTHGHSDNGA